MVTIGGAVVVDALPLRKQKKEALLASLKTLSEGPRQELLLARIGRRGQEGLSLADLVRETGIRKAALQPTLTALLQQKQVLQAGELIIAAEAFSRARQSTVAALDAFHKANPLVAGMSKEELREKLGLPPEIMQALLSTLTAEKKAEMQGEQVRLAGRGLEMKDEEARAKKDIEQAFAAAGLKVPFMDEVLARLPVDKARAQKLVTLLLRDRVLVKLADNLVFHQNALQGLRQVLAEQKTRSPKIDVARFKDLAGVSRKYAIPLLEYLDREHVTRRVGDERIIL